MRTIALALDRLLEMLRDPSAGFNAQLETVAARDGVRLKRVGDRAMVLLNAAADLLDQTRDLGYPQVLIFAEQMENQRREKFADFSGMLRIGAEVRVSEETVERIEPDVHRYVEALLAAIEAQNAEWAPGLVYGGRYSVSYTAARAGGHNFLQTARALFTLDLFASSAPAQ